MGDGDGFGLLTYNNAKDLLGLDTCVCLSASRWIGWNLELATWERPTTLGFTIVQEKVPVTTLKDR